MGRRVWLAAAGVVVVGGLAGLWWQYRYVEPFRDPFLTGRVVQLREDGVLPAVSVLVEPDPGTPPGHPVWVRVAPHAPVRATDHAAGTIEVGRRVRLWRAPGGGNGAVEFVSVVPGP